MSSDPLRPLVLSVCVAAERKCSFAHMFSLYLHLSVTFWCGKTERMYPSYSMVLMMNPSVGLTLFTSSFMIFFTIVVFPALSRPLSCNQPSWVLQQTCRGMPTTSGSAFLCPLVVLSVKSTAFYPVCEVCKSFECPGEKSSSMWRCGVSVRPSSLGNMLHIWATSINAQSINPRV